MRGERRKTALTQLLTCSNTKADGGIQNHIWADVNKSFTNRSQQIQVEIRPSHQWLSNTVVIFHQPKSFLVIICSKRQHCWIQTNLLKFISSENCLRWPWRLLPKSYWVPANWLCFIHCVRYIWNLQRFFLLTLSRRW